jgi:CHASE1-domain containing sensor protein
MIAILEALRDIRASTWARYNGPSTASALNRPKNADAARLRVGSSHRRRALWPTALLLVAALMATFAVWHLVARDARQDGERVFHALVNNAGAELRDAVVDYTQVLRGGAALFDSIDHVSRETWRTYVGTLEIEKR